MQTNKFILIRKKREYDQPVDRATIRISANAYNTLIGWAELTGMPLSELAAKAIKYAKENEMFVEE